MTVPSHKGTSLSDYIQHIFMKNHPEDKTRSIIVVILKFLNGNLPRHNPNLCPLTTLPPSKVHLTLGLSSGFSSCKPFQNLSCTTTSLKLLKGSSPLFYISSKGNILSYGVSFYSNWSKTTITSNFILFLHWSLRQFFPFLVHNTTTGFNLVVRTSALIPSSKLCQFST